MKIISIFLFFIFLIGEASGGGGDEFPQPMEVNDGLLQTAQYVAKVNGQFYEIDTPDIEIEIRMVKKHPLIVDSEKEEHLLINDEDRGVLPPRNDVICIEAPGCVIYGNVGLRNRLTIIKTGENSWRPQFSNKPNDAQQQHVRYYAQIDGMKYPTQGRNYDIDICGTGLLVDGKFYKNAVPTGHINEINRIEERIPVLGSPSKDIPLIAAGDVQRNTERLHTNAIGQQILGSVSLPEIPIGGNFDYINTGRNKHDGKRTFVDTKPEEKQKNKLKQKKKGKEMSGNFTNINDQANENIGGTQDIGGTQIGEMPPGGALHFNTGGNRNVGGTQTIGGIQIGRMPTEGSFHFNTGGNRNVSDTQNVEGIQIEDMPAGTTTEDNHNLDSAHEIGNLVASLRNKLSLKNNISINGQNYAVDGRSVSIGVEGNNLKVNGIVSHNSLTEQYIEIIQDRKLENITVNVPLALFSRENITVRQTQHIQAECDGNLYIGQSPGGCLRILCVDMKKRADTHGPKTKGNLKIKNTTIECVYIDGGDENVVESDGYLQITESPMGNVAMKSGGNLKIKNSGMERVHFESGGQLQIDESPMLNVWVKSGGNLNIKNSKMERVIIRSGGALQIDNINTLPMGSVRFKSGGSLSIVNSKIENDADMNSGGSFTITNSVIVNDAEISSGGSFTMMNSKILNSAVMTSGGSFTIKSSKIKNGEFECNGSMTIMASEMKSGSIVYGGSFNGMGSQIASEVHKEKKH
ncbi:hypothetical protein niasHT_000136 [Heterodera trifolii]|uniref:Uncharacterized protein n=1 Tax=Heterodera trifolii TaxID=157864 RepID=A0ABD2M318_9BILA